MPNGMLVSKTVPGLAATYAYSRKATLDLQIHSFMWSSQISFCIFLYATVFFYSIHLKSPAFTISLIFLLKWFIHWNVPSRSSCFNDAIIVHMNFGFRGFWWGKLSFSTHDNIPWHSNTQISANQMFMNLATLLQV